MQLKIYWYGWGGGGGVGGWGWGGDEIQNKAEAQRAWLQLAAGAELNLAILSYLRIMNLTFELTFY